MNEKEIEKEMEFLKHKLKYYEYEQNHILSDWMPRMVLIATMDITISLALFTLEFYELAILIFTFGLIGMITKSIQLRKEINKIVVKRLKLNAEIFKRYELLGVNVRRFSNL